MPKPEPIECELAVIGTGMAGMASALFAANRGISTVQIGKTGEIIFATGLLDLMGVHPVEEKKMWENPWEAIDSLIRDIPDHPYSKLQGSDIEAAFDEILSFFQESGVPYQRRQDRNCNVLTPLGTLKRTYCVPQSMWAGVAALEEKAPCLIVDFRGLQGFSGLQIVSTVGDRWPGLRTVRIDFPGMAAVSDLYAEQMASAMELSSTRDAFVDLVKPHIQEARAVGVPAMLGMKESSKVISELGEKLGVPIFEIPTMPPSVTGIRLKEVFERNIPARGVQQFLMKRVLGAEQDKDGFTLRVGNEDPEYLVKSKGAILATGRFIGKGLQADRFHIRETVFDLPVRQPASRSDWHHEDFLDSRGHPVNRAGVEIDDDFRPLDSAGNPVYENLFAAGSILAHQDWMRMKCGSGLAIATAYGAVDSFLRTR